MKKLVLDKSALQGMPRDAIARARTKFAFFLPCILLHEIASEKINERDTLAGEGRASLDRVIKANIQKAVAKAGNGWLAMQTAILWETGKGRSAKWCPTDRMPAPEVVERSAKEWHAELLDYEATFAALATPQPGPEDEEQLRALRTMNEPRFFRHLESWLRSVPIGARSKHGFPDLARQQGFRISRRFRPKPDWFCFGLELSTTAHWKWSMWAHGGAPAGRKKPANPLFDSFYIAFMAIADGLLSCDKTMLKLAWACWPDKRADIYSYDGKAHDIVPFAPTWET